MELILLTQETQGFQHQFHRIMGIFHHSGTQEKPFNIISPVKAHRQFTDLLRGKGCSRNIVAAPVLAILTIVDTVMDNKIFSREMHRPSEEKLWQIPAAREFPIPVPPLLRLTPEEVQATSYLAASARIVNFFWIKSSAAGQFMLQLLSGNLLMFFLSFIN